jgi:hypothetical protein
MRLIDKKGNVLGRINLVDLALVVFIIASLVALAVSYKNFNKRNYTENLIQKEVLIVKIECLTVPEDVADAVSIGDRDWRSDKDYWAVTDAVGLLLPRQYAERSGKDTLKIKDLGIGKCMDMILTLKMRVKKMTKEYTYNGEVIKLNGSITFATPLYNLTGRIIDVKAAG